ncbi:MAG: helix-turn-helix domain-containing protein [Candidatus Thermoplasmatota archaeon]|nr:helix-turn-helix domain-containing protein [Candidatus Thermoplasmatota archaeon]
MRKVVLRWNLPTIHGAKELGRILEICQRFEVLAHLGVSPVGIVQLAEISLQEGRDIYELDEIDSFQVMEIHEESEDGILASILCSHSLAKSAIELSNLHLQPPYSLDATRGMEMRVTGLTGAMRRFLTLLRVVLPPDKVSVITMRGEMVNGWDKILTSRQQEVLSFAVERGYYEEGSSITIKELAEKMGISRSTFGGHLQDAERAVMHKAGSDLN